jgi:hypothetical protein
MLGQKVRMDDDDLNGGKRPQPLDLGSPFDRHVEPP